MVRHRVSLQALYTAYFREGYALNEAGVTLRNKPIAMKNPYLRKFVQYVLNGLLISLPVFGTGYIVFQLFSFLDSIVPRILYNEDEMLTKGDHFSGWGILMLLLVLFVMGWFGGMFINDRIKGWFLRLLDKIPGINNLYKAISDVLSAFVGKEKKFNQPVLVRVSEQMELEMIGFITDTNLAELGNIQGKVAVYFPMSYSFSGHMMIVPIKNITRIERNAVDILKYTMSGGIVELDPENEGKVHH
jgi:uncharacterized membrane protein